MWWTARTGEAAGNQDKSHATSLLDGRSYMRGGAVIFPMLVTLI